MSDPLTLSPAAQSAIEGMFRRASVRGEQWIAVCRVAVGILSLSRSAWVWSQIGWRDSAGDVGLALAAFGVAVGFSLWVLVALDEARVSPRILALSVTVDHLVCFAALATNVIGPGPGYLGILRVPDVAALVVLIGIGGLRLSVRVVLLGGVLALLSTTLLVGLDATLNRPLEQVDWQYLSGFLVLIVASAAVGIVATQRTRALVQRSALKALEAARAERSLGELLAGHHDLRTLLSSATLNAQLLERELRALPQPGDARARVEQLGQDLGELSTRVHAARERARGDLLVLATPSRVALAPAVEEVVAAVCHRFPAVRIDAQSAPAHVWVAGGRDGLLRMLHNLLVNACEGDGRQGANHVWIDTGAGDSSEAMRIQVRDDGPGLPRELAQGGGGHVSRKSRGSGIGLGLVRQLARESGGRLELANRPDGGASATIYLPVADP